MATLARLQARSAALAHQYYFRNSVVDVFRKKENDAAVKIQSWFRGCRVRAHISCVMFYAACPFCSWLYFMNGDVETVIPAGDSALHVWKYLFLSFLGALVLLSVT